MSSSVDFQLFLLSKDGLVPADALPVPPDPAGYLVVDEFDNWVIREIHPTGRGVFIEWGQDYYPLAESEDLKGFVWPKGTKRYKGMDKGRHVGGYLYLYRPDVAGAYHELRPVIYVVAGSLSEAEYVLLLDRLGELAMSDVGAIRAPIASAFPLPGGVVGQRVGTPAVRRALAILRVWETFRQHWPAILRMPARQSERIITRIRTETPAARRSPQAVQQMARHSGQNHLWLPIVAEHADTPENRFVAFALQCIAADARVLARVLARQIDRLERDTAMPPRDAGDRAQRLWNQGRYTAYEAAEYLRGITRRLVEAQSWANEQLTVPLLEQSRRRAAPPREPSLRLTRSPGYGPIYAAYRRLFHADRLELQNDALQRGLVERTIQPTMQLYELWVFLEIYAILVEQFGFHPAGEEPIAHLEMQAGRLELKRKQTYILELVPNNDPASEPYIIRLTYEPPVDRPPCDSNKKCYLGPKCQDLPCFDSTEKHYSLGPDVVIVTEHSGATCTFALDAKYRRYASQPVSQKHAKQYQVETNFEIDVLGTAKQKYLNGMEYSAAFVVHSDPEAEHTYFGEESFRVAPHREKIAQLPWYADHRYGAIYAVPLKTRNLERLLKCLLMYHAGWHDICWSCGRRLFPGTDEQWDPPGRVSTYFQCREGHGFWAVSHCRRKHTLIKLGEDSFHRIEADDVWNCTCPRCGDRLGPQQATSRIEFMEPPPF